MKRGILFLAFTILMSSCITVKVYQMEPDSKVEPKHAVHKKSALISSEIIAPLLQGDTEVFFHGNDPMELNHFEFKDHEADSMHTNKRVFVFKAKDSDEAMRWVTKLSDSLEQKDMNASEFSGSAVFISDDNKNVRFKIKSSDLKPIIIIDDKEMESDFDIDSLDVEAIESMNVLKGQKALQKFGEKGKNGVIIIKTKS